MREGGAVNPTPGYIPRGGRADWVSLGPVRLEGLRVKNYMDCELPQTADDLATTRRHIQNSKNWFLI